MNTVLFLANEAGAQAATLNTVAQTVLMGLGTVFAGLVCIILICKLMSFIVRKTQKLTGAVPSAAAPQDRAIPASERGALCAAIAAAVAEELSADVEAIRIVSIKKR